MTVTRRIAGHWLRGCRCGAAKQRGNNKCYRILHPGPFISLLRCRVESKRNNLVLTEQARFSQTRHIGVFMATKNAGRKGPAGRKRPAGRKGPAGSKGTAGPLLEAASVCIGGDHVASCIVNAAGSQPTHEAPTDPVLRGR